MAARSQLPLRPDDPAPTGAVSEPVLDEVYRLYRRRVEAICFAYLHDAQAAEDAVQEVFLRAEPQLRAWRGGSLQVFLDRVTRNVCREEVRRRQRTRGSVVAETAGVVEPDAVAIDRRLIDRVWGQLSARERLLVIHRFAGYSQKEIAERLRISVDAVEMGLVRARRRARGLLDRVPAIVTLLITRRARPRRSAAPRARTLRRLGPPSCPWLTALLVPAAIALAVLASPPGLPAADGAALVHATVSPPPSPQSGGIPAGVDLRELSVATGPGTGGGTLYASGYRPGCAPGRCATLYRSTDGGDHWTMLPARGYAGDRVLPAPTAAGEAAILYASGPAGLQRSDDGGITFRTVVPVPGPAALVPGEQHGDTTVVIAAQPLRLYDTRTGRVTAGATLPAGQTPVDIVAESGGDVLVATTSGTAVRGTVLRCRLRSACDTVLVDTQTATLRLASDPSGGVAVAFSVHRLYLAAPGRPFTAVHDFGADNLMAVGLLRRGGAVTLLADVWSPQHSTGFFATSSDGGRDFIPRATQRAFAAVRSMVTTAGGRILMATDGSIGRLVLSSDGGGTWRDLAA